MNSRQPIQRWRDEPTLRAASPRGWTVVFAKDSNGRCPALDYMDGIAASSDPTFPMKDKHLGTLAGLLQILCCDGPTALRSKAFKVFVGDDARDGMCELRVVTEQGHRFLCFKRGDRQLLVAHAFRKPPQSETPPQEKEAARAVLHHHESTATTGSKHDGSHRRRSKR